MFVSANDKVYIGFGGKAFVFAHGQMGERDNQMGARAAQSSRQSLADSDGVGNFDLFAMRRFCRRLLGQQSENRHPHAAEVAQHVGRHVFESRAVLFEDVCCDVTEGRFADAFGEGGQINVEFVIAEHRDIELERVERGNHLLAFELF